MKIKKRNTAIKGILTVYLFLAIYAPPFFPINIFHFVSLISLIYILFHWRSTGNKVFKLMELKRLIQLILLLFSCFVIGALAEAFIPDRRLNDISQVYLLYQSVFLMIEICICALFICCIADRYYLNGNTILRCFINAGMIEFIFVIISYLSPEIRNVLLSFMGKNTGLSSLYTNYSDFLSYRGYGFALELLDTFGFGTGILAGIAYIYRKVDKKSYIVVACTLLANLLNSRTGLIVFAIFVLVDLFMGSTTKMTALKCCTDIMLIILFLLAWFLAAPAILKYIFLNTQNQIIKNTVRDLIQVLNLNYHTLRQELWGMPSNTLHWLFGTGHLVNATFSTVGFVNAIWSYGLAGCTILYIYIIIMFKKVLKKCKIDSMYYNIVFSLLVLFFIIQLKMPVFAYSAGGFSLYSLPFILSYYVNKKETIR